MVYSGKPGAFDAEAISLLENLASVIGFGVNLYRTTSTMLSERQKAIELNEEKLRALQLLNTIVDSSNEAIFAKDMEGRYLLFNRETLRQNGKSRDEVIGKKDDEVFPPEVAEGIRALLRNCEGLSAWSDNRTSSIKPENWLNWLHSIPSTVARPLMVHRVLVGRFGLPSTFTAGARLFT